MPGRRSAKGNLDVPWLMRSMASEAWPVWARIFHVGILAVAALVARPARREWLE